MNAAPEVLAARFLRAVRCASSALPATSLSLKNPCPFSHWIEIELLDEDDRPVADAQYKVTAPDGREYEGRLGAYGTARIEGLSAGECRVEFPRIDRQALARA